MRDKRMVRWILLALFATLSIGFGVTRADDDGWTLAFRDNFDAPSLSDRWLVRGGSWSVRDGVLRGSGTIQINAPLPGSVRVLFKARSDNPCDLSAYINADADTGWASGYFFGFGSEENAFSQYIRAGQRVRYAALVKPGAWHDVVVERHGYTLRHVVDDQVVFQTVDVKPLAGPKHAYVGLYLYNAGEIDEIQVFTRPDPDWKTPPPTVATVGRLLEPDAAPQNVDDLPLDAQRAAALHDVMTDRMLALPLSEPVDAPALRSDERLSITFHEAVGRIGPGELRAEEPMLGYYRHSHLFQYLPSPLRVIGPPDATPTHVLIMGNCSEVQLADEAGNTFWQVQKRDGQFAAIKSVSDLPSQWQMLPSPAVAVREVRLLSARGERVAPLDDAEYWAPVSSPSDLPADVSQRFKSVSLATLSREPGAGVMEVSPTQPLVVLGAVAATDQPVAGLTLELTIAAEARDTLLWVVVRDSLDRNRVHRRVPLRLTSPADGRVQIALQQVNQIVPPQSRFWLELRTEQPLALQAAGCRWRLDEGEPGAVLAAHLDTQMRVIHQCFKTSNEARPWLGMKDLTWQTIVQTMSMGQRRFDLAALVDALHHVRRLAPDLQIARWYLDELQVATSEADVDAAAPAVSGLPRWATLFRALHQQARSISGWWSQAQLPDGQWEGFADDSSFCGQNSVTAWLGYEPMLQTMRRLDRGWMSSPRSLNGWPRHRTDSLHAGDYNNYRPYLPLLAYGEPIPLQHAMLGARQIELWTAINPAGHRHFKGHWLSATQVGPKVNTQPAWDEGESATCVSDAMPVVIFNQHPLATRWFHEYSLAWAQDTRRCMQALKLSFLAEPRHVIFDTDELSPNAGGSQGWIPDQIWTGQALFGEPIFAELAATVDHHKRRRVLLQWRRLSGDTSRDDLLMQTIPNDPEGYESRQTDRHEQRLLSGWIIQRDKRYLERAMRFALRAMLDGQAYLNGPAQKSTDRVYTCGSDVLSMMATGGLVPGGIDNRGSFHPLPDVSWRDMDENLAPLVLRGDDSGLKLLLCNLGDAPLQAGMHTWRLLWGRYRLQTGIDRDGDDQADEAQRDEVIELRRWTPLTLAVPPRAVLVVELTQVEHFQRPLPAHDAALDAESCRVEGATLSVAVHNLGTEPLENLVVVVRDADGATLASRQVDRLDWPSDLLARSVEVRFDGLPAGALGAGVTVSVDPDDRIPEITETNNQLHWRGGRVQRLVRGL